jgi:hypothetical protein
LCQALRQGLFHHPHGRWLGLRLTLAEPDHISEEVEVGKNGAKYQEKQEEELLRTLFFRELGVFFW